MTAMNTQMCTLLIAAVKIAHMRSLDTKRFTKSMRSISRAAAMMMHRYRSTCRINTIRQMRGSIP